MVVSFIVAVSKNRVIGRNNDLPWRLPDDMKHFMQTTKGHYVIMGRKNYDSIPEKFRPLPNRTNVVVTRQREFSAPNCVVVHSLEAGVEQARQAGEQEVFIIGGAEIFGVGFPMAQRLYLTEILEDVAGDVFFPEWNLAEWKELSRSHHPADERHAFPFDFVIYERT